jgi:hypothetical protein
MPGRRPEIQKDPRRLRPRPCGGAAPRLPARLRVCTAGWGWGSTARGPTRTGLAPLTSACRRRATAYIVWQAKVCAVWPAPDAGR